MSIKPITFHILILFLHITNCTNQQIIDFNLNLGDQIIIETDTPKQYTTLLFDITSQITMREKTKKYASSTSKILKENIFFNYNSHTFQGELIQDNFYLKNKPSTAIEYSFFLLTSYPKEYKEYKEIMGMAYLFNNETSSILRQFKEENIINRIAFSISVTHEKDYDEIAHKQQVFLGGVSNADIATKNKIGTFKVLGKNGYWDCIIKQASIKGHFDITRDVYAYFDSVTSKALVVPNDFFEKMIDIQFSKGIKEKKCRYFSKQGSVACKCNSPYFEGFIQFVIDDFSYDISIRQLVTFDSDKVDCYFEVEKNVGRDEFVIGTKFLANWTILFDNEESKMMIYAENGIETVVDNSIKKISLIGLEVVVLLGGIILLINKMKIDKNDLN